MRDNLLESVLYRVRERHGPDGNLARTLRSISSLADQAREIHKERGPQAAQAVIRDELVPKYLKHVGEVRQAISTSTNTCIRDDWAASYGAAVAYKGTLSSLGRLTEGDWSMAEMDAGQSGNGLA